MRKDLFSFAVLVIAAAACEPPRTAAVSPTIAARGPAELRSLRAGVSAHGRDGLAVTWNAEVENAGGARAVLMLGDRKLDQGLLRSETGFAVHEPGDYHVVIEDEGGKVLGSRGVMVRSVPCLGGARRLMGAEVRPAFLAIGLYSRLQLTVPRWDPHDRDHAYVVEWLHDGAVVYEDRGRHASFDKEADRVERAGTPQMMSEVCGFSFGEVYDAPEGDFLTRAGAWEVRVHREGQPSIAAPLTVVAPGTTANGDKAELSNIGVGEQVFLRFRKVETPPKIQALLARIPSACQKQCDAVSYTAPTTPGKYKSRIVESSVFLRPSCQERTPPLPHISHSTSAAAGYPLPLAFSAEELRGIVRSKDVRDARWALNDRYYNGVSRIDRPGFDYNSQQSPDANWHARRAWENQDTARQIAQEAESHAGAAGLAAPLRQKAFTHGRAPWTAEETPAPQEGQDY